ncbi:Homeobox-leucine zipper protein ROC4 [Acorus calamus]|uniref:Homeobox-leucine zipper protein ROC4 n=1 Tax=Acorus calamus TaxID=4465 RepID=A0AAV9C8C6_ACOCL|nr:Homeobox-leucine zipper protein ROC4 [Acorus calamus]
MKTKNRKTVKTRNRFDLATGESERAGHMPDYGSTRRNAGHHQFDGSVGVGGHGAGLLSDDDFDAWITTLLEKNFDMTPIDFDMSGSNILDNKNKRKKSRHTKEHIQALNFVFEQCNRPNKNKIKELCEKLNMERSQIKIWFQNRRSHLKVEMDSHQNLILKGENHMLQVERRTLQAKLDSQVCSKCCCNYKDELRKENATLREKIHDIHQALNRTFLTSQHIQRYTGVRTSDPSLLSAINDPSSLFNVLESGLSSYFTTIPIIPQGNAPQSDIIFESSSLAFHQGF